MEKETVKLPQEFLDRMKNFLQEEYDAFVYSYQEERKQGLRMNPLKGEPGFLARELRDRFGLEKIPWTKTGYFYDSNTRPGKHPLHEAGVYYIQEPSAMGAAEFLQVEPGDRVLDLCAAPGGKSTQIAGYLMGRGVLVANEIHPARAKILSQNIERMGISNAVVMNEEAGKLAACFPEYFDKIMVDAPCSGEGMFRKDENAREEWSPDHVKFCARRQQEILKYAASMLKPGGRMVYSTCTFSPEENEGTVETFLRAHPEFVVEQPECPTGFAPGRQEWVEGGRQELSHTFRIWPHKARGEGHYMAVLKKQKDLSWGKADLASGLGSGLNQSQKVTGHQGKRQKPHREKPELRNGLEAYLAFAEMTFSEGSRSVLRVLDRDELDIDQIVWFGEQLYLLPKGIPPLEGRKVLRPGLHLGTWKKNRFEPSHALALAVPKNCVKSRLELHSGTIQTARYLSGEVLEIPEECSGWTIVCADGFPLGWGKASGGKLKNHYPKGLRKQGGYYDMD